MSFDLEVWSVRSFDESIVPPVGRAWQICVDSSDRVQAEDIPAEIVPFLPGIAYVTRIYLEGEKSKSALTQVVRLAKHIALASHGIVFNPQTDCVTTPSGVKRVKPIKQPESFSVLQMSWWFLESPILQDDGLERLLACFEQHLPEAVPRRYGLWEPPQHIYAETGRAHFLEFLGENLKKGDTIVWYTRRPVLGVYLGCPKPLGASSRGFRANRLSFSIEAALLEQPGWNAQIQHIWMTLSQLLRPFYGDVRILDGHLRGNYTNSNTESHPVVSWWWRGVPKTLGNAVVLGDVYQNVWPDFMRAAKTCDGLAICSSEDWSIKNDIASQLGGVPSEITQPDTSNPYPYSRESYAPIWPFEAPFIQELGKS
jgi:hypothetical protein